MRDDLDDATLVARAREGDGDAFGHLVRRYLRVAHAVARSAVGEASDADDVCQEAFLEALLHLEDCRDPGRFGGWLLAIVRNRAHNHRRYLARRAADPLDAGEQVAGPGNPGRDAELSELRARLLEGLDRLPEPQQQAVLLHDLEGRGHPEIARALGVSEVSSRQLLHRGRKALRRFLAGDPYVGEDR